MSRTPGRARVGTRAALRALVELRVRLFWRRLRGLPGLAEGVALALLFLAAIPIGLVFSGMVGAGSFRAARSMRGLPVDVGVPAVFFGLWQAWTAVSLSLNEREGLDLRRYLLYPIPPGRIWMLGVVSGLVGDPVAVFWLILLGGALIGAAAGRFGPWLALLAVDLALFAVATVLLVALLQELLARLLASRRIREIAIGAAAALAFWIATSAIDGERHTARELLAALGRAQWVAFPAALASAAARPLYTGDLGAGLPWLALLAAATCATGWAAFRLALASARSAGDGGRAPVPRSSGGGWRLPGLAPSTAALLEKEAKYLARHPLARIYAVIIPAFSALVAWKITPHIPADAGEVVRALPLFGFALYTHLVFQVFWLNGFGWDRGGARALYLAPLDPARVLLAKNGALYLVSLAVFGAAALLAGAAGGWPPGWAVAAAFALQLGIGPVLYGLGNLVSVLNPRAAPFGVARSGALSWLSGLAGIAILSAAVGLFALPVLLALRLEAPWLLPGAWIAIGVASGLVYQRTLPRVGALLERRREELLSAVCGDEG